MTGSKVVRNTEYCEISLWVVTRRLCTLMAGFTNRLYRLKPRAGFLNLGCWNQFQGVLGKVTYVAVKGKRNMFGQTCLHFIVIVTRC